MRARETLSPTDPLGVAICQTVDEIERLKDRFYKTSSEISGRGTIKSSERSITFVSERSRRVKEIE